ncbi:hypothetical protein [Actinokineospora xionganensis]|uniref:EF-hand domain-containing protein n=1 Tax=Actinokineospora xionganensis TaxID=2684470 RepID=A0ABR7LDS0_9PSEU|nr:hypothetical protein [Actinokineospora xionganensis]MBC6450865.1 hypothetical protein [Actinokineospora xionganensis]
MSGLALFVMVGTITALRSRCGVLFGLRATLALLQDVARRAESDPSGTITYKQLSEHLATLGLNVPYHGLMPDIPDDVSREENADGRGLISALVVQQGIGYPSARFYKFARSEFERTGDNIPLWLNECRLVRSEYQ